MSRRERRRRDRQSFFITANMSWAAVRSNNLEMKEDFNWAEMSVGIKVVLRCD